MQALCVIRPEEVVEMLLNQTSYLLGKIKELVLKYTIPSYFDKMSLRVRGVPLSIFFLAFFPITILKYLGARP